jgi:hypothetical protein
MHHFHPHARIDHTYFIGPLFYKPSWNKANPKAKITADGVYGPATAAAFAKAPCAGF